MDYEICVKGENHKCGVLWFNRALRKLRHGMHSDEAKIESEVSDV